MQNRVFLMAITSIAICLCAGAQNSKPPDALLVNWAAQHLDRYAQEAMARTRVPGMAIAVVFQNEIAFVRGYGVRDVTRSEKVDGDTVFQLASMSRPITSTALASLASEGYLDWDDAITDLDPDFKLSDEFVTKYVTVRDLLSHRSGLPAGAGGVLQDLGYSEAEILSRLQFLGPLPSFRYRLNDTSGGYTEAAHAAAREYGDTWRNILGSRLLQPLGMSSTNALYDDFQKIPNRAVIHFFDGKNYAPKYQRNADEQSPADGVNSSANDLAKWLLMLVNRGSFNGLQVIRPEVLEETFAPQIVDPAPLDPGAVRFYGLGWNVSYESGGRQRVSHSGAFHLGAGTAVAVIPSDQIGVVVLTNGSPAGLSEAMVETFFDLVYNGGTQGARLSQDWVQVFAQAFTNTERNPLVQDWSTKAKPSILSPTSLPLTAYEGTYHSDYYGDLVVALTPDNTLKLALGKDQKLTYNLAHWDGNTFTFRIEMESGVGTTAATFSTSGGGVSQVAIDNFTHDGDGIFTRIAPMSVSQPVPPPQRGARREKIW